MHPSVPPPRAPAPLCLAKRLDRDRGLEKKAIAASSRGPTPMPRRIWDRGARARGRGAPWPFPLMRRAWLLICSTRRASLIHKTQGLFEV
jgi:hypothetical protein